MNGAHWHLVVNHLPIIFPIVGVIVMITGLISKSEAVKRTAFMIFILGALASIAAMTTGEGAEEIVEKINGVTENYIESHEETAETFALLSYILGSISLLGLWASFKQKTFSNIIAIVTLVFAFVVLFFGKQTGTTGGEIRHTEIRSGNSIPAIENNNDEKDKDD
ncbi:hypothetical protein ACFSPU_13210 [Haoranjiania flava]|uniref:Uncharacterized protein n=1 Tax=Haoranjiania flava TaxID=1856322 RepID=A0AAE3IPJ8_9BACT|nr:MULTISPECIES: hypothetical protein [Bacteroidota]MBS1570829.1 hypothetical protein [Bacteroidota bacterium]MCU7695509.1 hypothetical protein [Haoranjiania flava]MDP2161463.1 hypothetical protein [Flavobacterium sp.]